MMDDAEPQAAQPKLEIVDEEDDGVERFTASSPIPKVYRTKNDNLTHLLFAKEEVGSEKKDSAIIEKLAEQFREENQGTIEACPILAEIGVDRIKQMVLGPRHVAFLLDDDNVIRMGYQSSKVKDIPVMQECSEIPSTMSQSAQQAAAAALQQSARTSGIAKYRRVMLGGRSYCGLRTGTGSQARGVIIGRPSAAQNIPVPEELINNVQQVLQGKSREIIIRELQRTGLNVNEAVNNLLSRDDGDDPMDMSGADPILPEELLQLLEHSSAAIGGHPLDDPFEALNFSRLTKRKELKNEKKKEQSEIYRSIFMLSPDVEWWRGEEGCGKPREVLMMDDTEPIVDEERMERQKGKCSPIVSITCTTWALYALHKNGKIYTWNWDDDIGSEHEFRPPNFEEKSAENVPVVMITSSNLRICAILQNGAMISWLETLAVGRRVQKATESYGQIPVEQVGLLKDFTTSDYIAAVRCENVVYWCGIYPPSDRSKSTEKAAEKSEKDRKKHVSFGETSISSTTSNSASSGMNSASNSASGSSEIHVGSQVQLKKSPIFPAGSVGVFIDTEKPMIGVLLEDSWNFGENCRFRILSVEEYDGESVKMEILEEEEEQYVQQPNQSRKRKAAEALSDPFHDDPVQKIEIWPIDEVLWIHEHRKRDVMTVEVVDNQMVAVKFNETSRNCMKYASLISDNPEGNSRSSNQQTNQGMRILRKDELQVLKNPAKNGEKLAKLVQKEVLSFMIDMSKPIISMCADLTGFRILVRSRHDQILLCKVPVTGKVVMRSRLPLNALAVEKRILRGAEGKCPELVNFGDSRTLFIRDSAGQLIPLLRDALNGYREPQILHSQPINLISTYSRPKRRNGSICEKGATAWEGSVLCIPGTNRPNHRHFLKDFASLMQLVLYCDLHGVQAFLNKINDLRQSSILSQDEFRQIMSEQLFAITSDGCSNIIHAAIRLCVAARNSQNQDKITPETLKSTPPKFAAKNVENEKRWKGVLRGRRRSQEVEDGQEIEENIEVLQSGTVVEDFSMGNPIKTPEIRQKNAMGILDLLLKHLTMFFDIEAENGVEFLDEKDRCSALKALLSARDINGRTPFMLAVNLRAYGAAGSVWQCLLQLGFADMNNYEQMQYIYPPVNDDPATIFSLAVSYQSPPDDSPLFVLCYNDVCSFTWTGAEHINQDIYECRTCGITGSFCCCSECAISCHRNHDCKIKKSCPTAYCDCWQKCGCKSLISGNEKMREYLFVQLLKHTELYELANSRGEHLMLFLARTVIRQYREQNGFQAKKKSSRANRQDLEGLTPPEHDLSAPKFAKFALDQCCKKPEVVKSAINLGAIELDWEVPMSRNDVLFNTQSSAVHLDRLTFTLMNKRVKEYTVAIINTLRAELSSGKENRDPHVEKYTARFVRSIIRVLVLAINVSPIAASIIMSGEEIEHTTSSSANSGSSSSFARETIRFSNLISLNAMGIIPVSSKKDQQKDKSSQMISFVSRIIAILRSLPVFAILELAQAADSIFSPVRFGLARPIQSPILVGANSDPIDVMEKYFSSDVTFEEVLKKARREEMKQEKRVRRNSRRDQNDRDRTESERRDSSNDQDEESQDGLSRNSTGNRGVRRTRTRNVSIPEENPQEIQREPDDEIVRDAEMEEEEEENEEEEDEEEDDDEEEETVRGGETQRDETVRFINDEDEEDEEDDDDDDDEEEEGEETERGRVRPAEWQYEASSPSDGEGDDEERRSNDAPQDDNSSSQPAFRIPPPTSGGPPIPVQIPINSTVPQADPRANPVGQDEDDFLSRQHQIASRFGLGGGSSTNSSDNTTTYTFRGGSWSSRASTTSAGRYLQYRFGSSPRYGETNSGSSTSAAQAPSNGTSTSTSTTSTEPSTSGPTSSTSAPAAKKEPEEPKAQLSITRKHLAMTFSLLTRLACDIIAKTHQKTKKIYDNSHEMTLKLFKNIQESLRRSTKETFDWMFMVLDSTEAKLRFNAQFLEHLGAQGAAGDTGTSQASADGRRDAFGYIFGLMRGCGNDARDRLAEVDLEILEAVGLVLDAYLVVEECGKQKRIDLKMLIDQFEDASCPRFKQQHSAVDADLLCGFFRRPLSMQFVGDFFDGAWNTLSGRENMRMLRIEQDIPLVERPDMLSIDADHSAYFRPQEFEFLKMSKRKFLKNSNRCEMYYALPNSEAHKQSIESQIKDHYQGILDRPNPPTHHSQAPESGSETGAVAKMRARLQAEALPIFSTYQKCIETIAQQHYDGICEALGNESSKSGLLQRIARFGVKHQQIIKSAEKYRSCHSSQKEVTLDVHRDQCQLVIDTMLFLNQIYNQKVSAIRHLDSPMCPLAGTRLRVRFIDEPGEGTGVTRSYYTALAEACMTLAQSPFNDIRRDDLDEITSSLNWQLNSCLTLQQFQLKARRYRREKAQRLRNAMDKLRTFSPNLTALKFTNEKLVESLKKMGVENAEEMIQTVQEEAQKYVKNGGSNAMLAQRICTILCQLPPEYLRNCAENQDSLRCHIQQILVELRADADFNFDPDYEPEPNMSSEGLDAIWAEIHGPEQGPLFVKSPNGYTYVPAAQGPNRSLVRLSAYRNIGRVMGICISQGDIFPLRFARHVFAYILRQPITWLDFGFFDPEVFNSLRCLMCGNQEEEETFACATFSVDLMSKDSSQIIETIDLKPDGRNIAVTKENVTEYIYRYVDRILLGHNLGALEAIREGILDVIPESMLAGLNPEDLKLILCGTEQICIETLQANTVFLDESRANSEILAKFKQSFWQVVESLSREEKQDLIFFWTGSASLPGEWQTNASVMLRPQEDMLLPTANTCISRLYVPVYSTKRILKSKLLMAIKAKNFGFV